MVASSANAGVSGGSRPGNALRQHRLAGPWRADEQQVVATRCGHLQRLAGDGLAAYIGQVGARRFVVDERRRRARRATAPRPLSASTISRRQPATRTHPGEMALASRYDARGTTGTRSSSAPTIGATPATARSEPSSPSSPTKPNPATASAGISSWATSSPTAIARSSPEPPLRWFDGARLTVIRHDGQVSPLDSTAARTRSRDSRQASSGSPTIWKAGSPVDTWTSTVTGRPSTPRKVAERTAASMRTPPATATFERRVNKAGRHDNRALDGDGTVSADPRATTR